MFFSHFLVKTLKENEKPFLVPSDFFADIKAGVAENAEQFPRFGSLKDTGGQQGGELVLFLKQDAKLKALSTESAARQKEFERLQRMEAAAEEARRKEAEEIVRREKELGELDAKIEAMRKRLGSPAVKADDSLDAMLAIVMQKEEQERRLEELRKQKEEEEKKRQAEIASLKRDRDVKVIAMLKPEVEKYKRIVSSKYGKRLKSEAWKNLAAMCPPGWTVGVGEYDTDAIIESPGKRKLRCLFVDTDPFNTDVELVNAGLSYYPGMKLEPGQYVVEVAASGYETQQLSFTHYASKDSKLKIQLISKVKLDRLKLIGTWEGRGCQSSGSCWTISIHIPPFEANEIIRGTISYPSLGCTARLEFVKWENKTAVFRERYIKKKSCVDNGWLYLTPNDASKLDYVWAWPSGKKDARTVVNRVY